MESSSTFGKLWHLGGLSFNLLTSAFGIFTILLTGCGGNPSGGNGRTGPISGEFTTVAIQVSSTANDEFVGFGMKINQISLTNKTGVTTTIVNTPTFINFIPSNGNASPFVTVSVPQDVYVSAAVSVSDPEFTNVSMTPQGQLYLNTDAYGYTPTPPVVNLPTPITVEGSTMGLTLDLLAAQSGSYTGLEPNQTAYSINPTFNLTAFEIPAEATSAQNGKCVGILGQVASVDSAANSITVTVPGNPITGNPSLKVALGSATGFQGTASASGLTAGMLVNMDLALQLDASYAATRVEVQDATATNVAVGQLLEVDPSYSGYITTTADQQVGDNLSVQPIGMGAPYMYGSSTKFQTSALFLDLSNLPFSANFSATSLAAGQMVSLASNMLTLHYPYTLPTSATLVPQSIDAVVNAVSTSGSYTVYMVELAPYDLIVQMNSSAAPPVLAVVPNPNTVYVYTNASTLMQNSATLDAGGAFRFNGLLFNDSGTLRMVAGQVNDGVPQ